MADFSSTEKINASWKHLFSLLPTSNADGSGGRFWYEEPFAATHVVTPADIWSSTIPEATSQTQARAVAAASGTIIEDRSQGESVTLVSNGSDWNITTTTIVPKKGFQLTDTHPSPSYIKSITNVVDNGGGSYTITLTDNSGVSAGASILQSRIFLTEDVTSNGLAWFAEEEYGNGFSDNIVNFIQSQLFGKGYTIRLYQANGTEVTTTEGAWIPHYQKGLIIFANGFTPSDLTYSTPMYIEAFRYIGAFGGGSSLPAGNLNDTLRWDGAQYSPTGALKSDGTNVSVLNRLTISGSLVTASGLTPSGTFASGDEGEVRWDDHHLYLHDGTQWRRTDFAIF